MIFRQERWADVFATMRLFGAGNLRQIRDADSLFQRALDAFGFAALPSRDIPDPNRRRRGVCERPFAMIEQGGRT